MGQNPPQPVPRIPDPYPTILVSPPPVNPKDFDVNWTTQYPVTPTPFHPAQTTTPFWNIVWNYGDGLFSLDPSPQHFLGDTTTKTASLKMVASYSGDRPPPVRKGSVSALSIPTQPNAFNSNFNIQTASIVDPENRQRVRLIPHIAAARLRDTLFISSIFRTLGQEAQEFQDNFLLEVEVPKGVRIYGINNNFEPEGSSLISGKNRYQWNINLFSTDNRIDLNPQNREGARWLGFYFSDDVLNYLPQSALTGESGDLPDSLPQYDTQLTFKLRLKNRTQEAPNNRNVLNLDNPDNPGASTTNLNSTAETFTLPVRLSYSRDPNSMESTPATICSMSEVPAKWNFMVHFENLGSAAADTVKVFPHLDDAFSPASITLMDHSPAGAGITCTWNAAQGCFILTKNSGSVLPGKQEAIALGFPVTAAMGYVRFTVSPDAGHQFDMGDQLSSRALIRMDQDSVWTNNSVTSFGGPACRNISLPWILGVKAGVNRAFSPLDLGGSGGFHAGVTLRKALCGLPETLETQRTIGPNDLPAWWYQGEIMYGSYKHVEDRGIERSWTSLDLVPLQIRWVPKGKTLPAFGPRSLALSAGYQLSVPLSTELGGEPREFRYNFFGRLEHGVFGDVAVFNPIGVPGLSLGARMHVRRFRVLDPAETGAMFQLYLHYNLLQLQL